MARVNYDRSIHVLVKDEQLDPVQARLRLEGRNLSWLVRHAMELYLHNKLPLPGAGNHEKPPRPLRP